MAKAEFERLRRAMKAADEKREGAIARSRDAVRLSKQLIYALHRQDMKTARSLLPQLKSATKGVGSGADIAPQIRISQQEYVEAACFLAFVDGKALPTARALGVEDENYLMGLCDLAGEVSRFAMNSAIRGQAKEPVRAHAFLEGLYDELLLFDFRNGELRRKFDGVKYEVKKVADLAFEMSRK